MSGAVDVLTVLDSVSAGCSNPGCAGCVEIARIRAAVAELIEAAEGFSRLYGHLWDLVEPAGSGFLSPESVVKYDEAHEKLEAAIARVQGGAK